MFFMHATGTGKTTMSLLIISQYLEIPGVSVYVLGFENTKEVFTTDAFKFPELGYVSQAEYARLLHLRNNFYANPTPLARSELQSFTQRLKMRLTSRSKKSGIYFYGYQEFANRCGFVDTETSDTKGDVTEVTYTPNIEFIDSLKGSFIVADEITHAYNTREVNSRGEALEYALKRLGADIHFIALSATPMNNHPAESLELAKLLHAGLHGPHGPHDPQPLSLDRKDYFRDETLINEAGLMKLYEGRISVVTDTDTHLYPRRVWGQLAEPMKLPTPTASGTTEIRDFLFIKCQMPAYQVAAHDAAHGEPIEVAEVTVDEPELASNSTYFLQDFALPKDPAALEALVEGGSKKGRSLDSAPPCLTVNDLQNAYGRVTAADWETIVDQRSLDATSGKYARLRRLLPTFRGKTLIFHPRIRWGVEFIQHIMEAEGYVRDDEHPTDLTPCAICGETAKQHQRGAKELIVEGPKSERFGDETAKARPSRTEGYVPSHKYVPARYVMMHGGVDAAQLKRARNQFNQVSNTYGADIQFVVGSRLIAMGYDFNALQNIVVCGFPDTYHMLEQLFGRGDRKLSHANLPPEKRIVNLFILVNMEGDLTVERYVIKYPVYETINQIMRLFARIAVDRPLFESPNGTPGGHRPWAVERARYYAYGLFHDELANIYRVIKRLFLIRPIWKYDDLIAAVRLPPFNVNVDMAKVAPETVSFILQRILYREADRSYLNMVKGFARANDATSMLFTLDAESKFFIRSGQVCVLIWRDPFLVLQPVNVQARSVAEALVAQQKFVQYRLNLRGTEVTRLLEGVDSQRGGVKWNGVDSQAPTYKLFHEYDSMTHNMAVRTVLESAHASKYGALLKFYTGLGIIRNASEYWQNSIGYRLVGGNNWISTGIERPVLNDIVGFYEDQNFKIIRPAAIVNSAKAADTRTHERGMTCMNKSTVDLQALVAELKLPASIQKAARSTMCRSIEEHMLEMQRTHGAKRTWVLFWGAPS
jgi:hypothetical protein